MVTNSISSDPPSPCRQICVLKGRICQGCGRSLDEIAAWPTASTSDKRVILRAAEIRLDTAIRCSGR